MICLTSGWSELRGCVNQSLESQTEAVPGHLCARRRGDARHLRRYARTEAGG